MFWKWRKEKIHAYVVAKIQGTLSFPCQDDILSMKTMLLAGFHDSYMGGTYARKRII